MHVRLMIPGFGHRSPSYVKTLFVRLINSSNYQRKPARLRVSSSRVIRGEALGPQDEDIERNMREAGSRSHTAGRFIREFIRFHVATEWIRDEHRAR